MKMSMVWADEDVNVNMYLFYLSSVLRIVSVDTQRVETGPVKCNSITKDPGPLRAGPRPRWTGIRAQLLFYLGSFACAVCLVEYIALVNQSRPPLGRPVQVTIRGR